MFELFICKYLDKRIDKYNQSIVKTQEAIERGKKYIKKYKGWIKKDGELLSKWLKKLTHKQFVQFIKQRGYSVDTTKLEKRFE